MKTVMWSSLSTKRSYEQFTASEAGGVNFSKGMTPVDRLGSNGWPHIQNCMNNMDWS